MNIIKKEAYEAVVKRVESDLASAQYKVIKNKLTFKKLVNEQTRLKRERGILYELLRTIRADKGTK
jgi:hypothetical protein